MRSLLFVSLFALGACRSPVPSPTPPAATSAGPSSGVSADALRAAELRRDSAAIGSDALSSRDVTLRRGAARALSRIADAPASEQLALALSDEDADVVTWAAYGLGYACRGNETKTVRVLSARAASLPESAASSRPLISPAEAIADALGRCGGRKPKTACALGFGGRARGQKPPPWAWVTWPVSVANWLTRRSSPCSTQPTVRARWKTRSTPLPGCER